MGKHDSEFRKLYDLEVKRAKRQLNKYKNIHAEAMLKPELKWLRRKTIRWVKDAENLLFVLEELEP